MTALDRFSLTLGGRRVLHDITLLEDHYAIDLITSDRLGMPGRRCHGLYALDLESGRTVTIEVHGLKTRLVGHQLVTGFAALAASAMHQATIPRRKISLLTQR